MQDKKLTPADSMELITTMIAATRRHFTKGEGNMLLFWGYLCVIVAVLSIMCGYIQYGTGTDIPFPSGLVWWAIPIIGIPYTIAINHKNRTKRKVVTYTDTMTITLWNYVLLLAIAAIAIGMIFYISGFSVWYVMELFTFFVVGMASSVQGIIIKEKSMIYGGAFSVLSGGFLIAGLIGGCYWLQSYSSYLFIISFIVMMIIPGHILNHKANTEL
ncbi:MAG: hypothetical protein NC127_08180 [Muribaculum sp.]|nr:hypothetical protein [Muribaculum sp.]